MQRQVQLTSMFNIFFVGLPMAYLMAITLDLSINGLWYGAMIGFGFNLLSYSRVVFTTDWCEISVNIQNEMQERNSALEESLLTKNANLLSQIET